MKKFLVAISVFVMVISGATVAAAQDAPLNISEERVEQWLPYVFGITRVAAEVDWESILSVLSNEFNSVNSNIMRDAFNNTIFAVDTTADTFSQELINRFSDVLDNAADLYNYLQATTAE